MSMPTSAPTLKLEDVLPEKARLSVVAAVDEIIGNCLRYKIAIAQCKILCLRYVPESDKDTRAKLASYIEGAYAEAAGEAPKTAPTAPAAVPQPEVAAGAEAASVATGGSGAGEGTAGSSAPSSTLTGVEAPSDKAITVAVDGVIRSCLENYIPAEQCKGICLALVPVSEGEALKRYIDRAYEDAKPKDPPSPS